MGGIIGSKGFDFQKRYALILLIESLAEEVVRAAEIVTAKSAEDGAAYRKWLVYLAERTAEGSKEGGFLGINAVRVSEKESQALDQLRTALGVSAG